MGGVQVTFFNLNRSNRILVVGLLFSSLLLLQGCGSRKPITISSQPEGADIIADGKNIGKTPLKISQDDVFPPRWHGTSYMVKGKLELKKAGCDPFSMNIDDMKLSKDISADLKCRPGAVSTPAVSEPAVAVPRPNEPANGSTSIVTQPVKPTTTDAIEQRLERLKELRDRGAITADEYAAQRKRILDSL
jgi:hypothetical protein